MKKLLIVLFVLSGLLFNACSENNSNKTECKYIAVLVSGDDYWSILDVNTGDFLYRNEFKNAPSAIIDDVFFVKKDKDVLAEMFNVHNISNSINNKSYIFYRCFQAGVAPVLSKIGDPFAIVNTQGEENYLGKDIVFLTPFYNGFSTVMNKKGKFGVVDVNGSWIVKADYDAIYPFSAEGFAIVCKKNSNNKPDTYTIIDKEGNRYYTFNSDKYVPIRGMINGSIPVRKDNKVVYIDKDGNRILDVGTFIPNSEHCYGVYDGLSVFVSDDNKMGLMTLNGEKIIRDKYDLLFPFPDKKFLAIIDDKARLIDKDDHQFLKTDYLNIFMINSNRFFVQEGENWSLIDKEGNEVCKETFSKLEYDAFAFGILPYSAVEDSYSNLKDFTDIISSESNNLFEDSLDITNLYESLLDSDEDIEDDEDFENETGLEDDETLWETIDEAKEVVETTIKDAKEAVQASNSSAKNLSANQLVEKLLPSMKTRKLTENDIKGYDKQTLRILRNAIFAKHGYKFQSKDLTDFFSQFSWYSARLNDVTAELNSIEEYNINFIKNYE